VHLQTKRLTKIKKPHPHSQVNQLRLPPDILPLTQRRKSPHPLLRRRRDVSHGSPQWRYLLLELLKSYDPTSRILLITLRTLLTHLLTGLYGEGLYLRRRQRRPGDNLVELKSLMRRNRLKR
jgi:hypothetical protein